MLVFLLFKFTTLKFAKRAIILSIFGIGDTRAKAICNELKLDPATKVSDLAEDQLEFDSNMLYMCVWCLFSNP
jgi:ribosomal protein S13